MSQNLTSSVVARMSTDFVLSTHLPDIRWLTGFTGSAATMLVSKPGRVVHLFVDGRYVDQAGSDSVNARMETVVHRVANGQAVVAAVAHEVSNATSGAAVGVDERQVTHAQWKAWDAAFTVVGVPSVFETTRRVKDESELSRIAEAAAIADRALSSVVADGLCGRTEHEVQMRLEWLMRNDGADDVAFPTIVATGVAAAHPHHRPTATEIVDGDMVVIDMGAMIDGYRSDMTRTIAVGSVSDELWQMFELVRSAQEEAKSRVGVGVPGREIDAAARSVFEVAGVADEFVHGTGHGVGLEIHENPILGPSCDTTLLDGEVVTVEPGLYRKGVGGVRIEDLVVVTGGSSRTLTLTSKELSCPRSARMI